MPKYYKRVRVEYTFYSDAIEAETDVEADEIAKELALTEPENGCQVDITCYDPKDWEVSD